MKIAVCILRYHRLMNDTGQPGKKMAMKPKGEERVMEKYTIIMYSS
jgi:hypothetical protein